MPIYEDGSYQCLPGGALIAKVLAGRCKMHYTRATVGQGTIPEEISPKSLAEPPDYVMDAKIASITNPVDGECQVTVQIYSADVDTGFYATGIMLYAEDPDLGEVPYTYLKLEEGMEWIRPASSAIGKLATFDLIVAVGAVDAVSAGIAPDAVATYEAVKRLVEEHDTSSEAHSRLLARMKAMEVAVNGSVTIIQEGDPTAETEGVKGQHYINLKTGMEWECTGVTDAGYVWGPVDHGSENFKSMRDILNNATATANQAKKVADGAAQAIAAVQNTISVIPSQSGSLTYNGSAQKPSWNNYATEMMEVTYGSADDPEERIAEEDFNGETAAGTHMAYFTPKEDYTWGDKSREERAVPWTVQRATTTTAPSVTGTLTYTGAAQSPAWQNFNPVQLTKEETAQTDAGTHSTSFTPTANYQWSGGDTSARAIPWTINRAIVSAVPEQSGTLTHTGEAQSPTWSGYDSAKLSLGGDVTGVNAGSHTATFTPTKNYQWSNGGTEARSVTWSIGKAAGSLSLDKTSMALNASSTFGTITANKAGDGTISAQSSNTNVATVNVSGNTVLVTGVADGSATITINVAEGSNHTAPQNKTCSVTVDFSNVFGVCWNKTISTALTRLTPSNDPNGLVTVNITTNPAPAVGTGAGSSPFDNYAPWKDMEEYNIINNAVSHKRGASGFSRTNYDTMVYIPEFYFKIVESGGKRYFYISSGAKSGFTKHPGSGKYVARYNTISGYFSKSGAAPLGSMTRAQARTNSKAKGNKWSQYDFATWNAVWLLYLVEFADWDSQTKIGKGNVSTSNIQNNGGTDSMTYHTGRAAGTDGQTQVQYRHIENPWGNIWEWIDGANFNARKSYICTNPANYADDTTTNYTDAGVTLPSSGWIKDLGLSNNCPWAFLPNTAGGSETTYIPDYMYSNTGWCVLMGGGYYSNGSDAGLFCFYANHSSSDANGSIGARLLYHP